MTHTYRTLQATLKDYRDSDERLGHYIGKLNADKTTLTMTLQAVTHYASNWCDSFEGSHCSLATHASLTPQSDTQDTPASTELDASLTAPLTFWLAFCIVVSSTVATVAYFTLPIIRTLLTVSQSPFVTGTIEMILAH